ncbi:MAG TPA: GNAT family N-acetyltransferase [Dehalococcoidia bacterium]|nr:GNAT family N-acetyltransferase [Dehalococcoidia bacterium]
MAGNPPSFRRATTDDAEEIASVIDAVMKDAHPVGFERAYSADEVRTWLSRLGDAGAVFLCFVEGSAAGFSALDFNTQEPDTATLGVWLRRRNRGKGLGTDLARLALDFARDRGYRRIRGRLPAGNEVALSFLSSIGALVPIYNPNMRFELPL